MSYFGNSNAVLESAQLDYAGAATELMNQLGFKLKTVLKSNPVRSPYDYDPTYNGSSKIDFQDNNK